LKREKRPIRQFVGKSDEDAFKKSAGPFRHGFKGGGQAEKSEGQTREMTFNEARTWIRNILLAWQKKLDAGE
jgi:hypothetical protein